MLNVFCARVYVCVFIKPFVTHSLQILNLQRSIVHVWCGLASHHQVNQSLGALSIRVQQRCPSLILKIFVYAAR